MCAVVSAPSFCPRAAGDRFEKTSKLRSCLGVSFLPPSLPSLAFMLAGEQQEDDDGEGKVRSGP
jgi:hypothetical protein